VFTGHFSAFADASADGCGRLGMGVHDLGRGMSGAGAGAGLRLLVWQTVEAKIEVYKRCVEDYRETNEGLGHDIVHSQLFTKILFILLFHIHIFDTWTFVCLYR